MNQEWSKPVCRRCSSVPSVSWPGSRGAGSRATGSVEPHRARAGQDADRMARPDRVPVRHPFDVMPHPVAVDDRPTSGLGDADHPAVDMCRHAGDEGLPGRLRVALASWRARVVVPADATGGNDDGLRTEFELADDVAVGGDSAGRVVGSQHRAAHTGHRAMVDDEVVHPMAGQVGDAVPPAMCSRARVAKGLTTPCPSPRDVEARDGLPWPVAVPSPRSAHRRSGRRRHRGRSATRASHRQPSGHRPWPTRGPSGPARESHRPRSGDPSLRCPPSPSRPGRRSP